LTLLPGKFCTLIDNEDKEAINAITEGIKEGHTLKTDLIKYAHNDTQIGRRRLTIVLDRYSGDDWFQGHRWDFSVGEKGAKKYELLEDPIQIRMDE